MVLYLVEITKVLSASRNEPMTGVPLKNTWR